MTSKYAVVQFYPDQDSDDRLDVGVIAWDAAGAHVLFIESWERLDSISVEDVRLLQGYADEMRARLSDRAGSHLDETGELAGDLIGDPASRIRLTPARSVAEDAPTLISSLAAKFHYAPTASTLKARDRRTAASHAFKAIVSAARGRRFRGLRPLIHSRRTIDGKFAEHELDVVLAADEPLAAVSGLSFEVKSRRHLQQEVDATAWVLDDLLRLRPHMPLAVFVLPATHPDAETVQNAAAKVFRGLGVRMIAEEATAAKWALRQLRSSPLSEGPPTAPLAKH